MSSQREQLNQPLGTDAAPEPATPGKRNRSEGLLVQRKTAAAPPSLAAPPPPAHDDPFGLHLTGDPPP